VLQHGVDVVDFLTEKAGVLPSKREARELLKSNAISINKEKVPEDFVVNTDLLLNGAYILVQKGKKNYHLVICR
jgi:tyrosyl-tRNA synthetase